MPRHSYSEINLHIVWHTKHSEALITSEVEQVVYQVIREKVTEFRAAAFHEVGGIENHVHVVVRVPPTVLISEFIGKLKGASAHRVNSVLGSGKKILEWQQGYGLVSFGTQHLEWVRRYVRNQKEHHARGATFDRLERIVAEERDPETAGEEANGEE